MEKISVVIPTFNGQKFIREAIQSVINQDYKNVELIISDDGSSDGTITVVNEFQNSNIFLYHRNQDQKGIFPNLNYAISKVSGDYIQILCQDDVLENGFLSRQMEIFRKNQSIGMVFSNVKILNEKSEVFDLGQKAYLFRENYLEIFPKVKSLDYFTIYGCMPGNLSPVMLRKSTFDRIGNFNSSFPYAGDFEYWIRVAFQFDIAYNRNNYVLLRRHEEQASKSLIKKSYHLFKEIGEIYMLLSKKAFLGKKEKEIISHLNQGYGVLFLKSVLSQVRKNNFLKISEAFSYLNSPPFYFKYIFYYFIIQLFLRKSDQNLIKIL